jgi:beta-glucanase (GH16 family)
MAIKRVLFTTLVLSHASLVMCEKGDWIDPDTPAEAKTTLSLTLDDNLHSTHYTAINQTGLNKTHVDHTKRGREFQLVMSDEFNVPGRDFSDGQDPKWTAMEKNDYTNDALHYYAASNIVTNDDGELEIITEAKDTEVIGFNDKTLQDERLTKHFRSGMLQSWNKFCFTGGVIETEVQLPGYSDIGGLWPAFWLLGNLARHTYVPSSTHVWPFSSHVCNEMTRHAQKISGCSKRVHYDIAPGFGRGAPEIDVFEMQPGPVKPNTGQYLKSFVGQVGFCC